MSVVSSPKITILLICSLSLHGDVLLRCTRISKVFLQTKNQQKIYGRSVFTKKKKKKKIMTQAFVLLSSAVCGYVTGPVLRRTPF